MQRGSIIDIANASNAEIYEQRLGGIIENHGQAYTTSVVDLCVEKSPNAMATITRQFFGINGGEIDPQEIVDYVNKSGEKNATCLKGKWTGL